MLANAVRNDKAKRAQEQKKTLSQQIFSSSPPAATMKESGHGSQKFLGLGRAPLQIQSASTLNGDRRSAPTVKPFKNPMKRSSSSFSDLSESSSSSKSRKLSMHSSQRQTIPKLSKSLSGVNQALHDGVTFDEDNFPDADEDQLIMAESLANSHSDVKYPDLSAADQRHTRLPESPTTIKTPPSRSFLQSSGAVTWSSSPESHRYALHPGMTHLTDQFNRAEEAPVKKNLLGRQLPEKTPNGHMLTRPSHSPEKSSSLPSLTQVIDKAQDMSTPRNHGYGNRITEAVAGYAGRIAPGTDRNTPIELGDSPEEAAKRGRRLPWLDGHSDPEGEIHETGSKRTRRLKKEKPERGLGNVEKELMTEYENIKSELATPRPKTQMWDQTPNAIKAEQKKLRQQQNSLADNRIKIVQDDGNESSTTEAHKAKAASHQLAEVFLSAEQQRVLNLVVEKKKSVFFTGPAGTGKSVLTREIITHLKKKYKSSPECVAVTASTGLAACNIGGNTLHSFAGIGLGSETAEQLAKKVKKNQKAMQRWNRTKVLIVDEISMIDGALFDKLEQIARIVRKKPMCFGGIQLVLTGDFFQLPPVTKGGAPAFAFDAGCWKTALDHTIGLTHVFRQKDPVFAGMLNEMRVGKLSNESIKAFSQLQRPISKPGEETNDATELFPTRYEVERANKARMDRLVGEAREYVAFDGGTIQDEKRRTDLLNNGMAPQSITFKKGAQVMLIKNIDGDLVNGSIGKVVDFMDQATFDAYDANERVFISSGGDLDKMAAAGVDLQAFRNKGASTAPEFPVVRFLDNSGRSRDLLAQREVWKIEQPNGEVLASRAQVPLILAWALSIHKAQGQTLEKVKVDLGRIFEKGQAYVALSRATTQEGLQIRNFNANKVMAHDKVRRFYDTLYGVDTIGGVPKTVPSAQADQTKAVAAKASVEGFEMTDELEAEMLAFDY